MLAGTYWIIKTIVGTTPMVLRFVALRKSPVCQSPKGLRIRTHGYKRIKSDTGPGPGCSAFSPKRLGYAIAARKLDNECRDFSWRTGSVLPPFLRQHQPSLRAAQERHLRCDEARCRCNRGKMLCSPRALPYLFLRNKWVLLKVICQ